ncbi:unnamed protein product, partial [Allacma fusca]
GEDFPRNQFGLFGNSNFWNNVFATHTNLCGREHWMVSGSYFWGSVYQMVLVDTWLYVWRRDGCDERERVNKQEEIPDGE